MTTEIGIAKSSEHDRPAISVVMCIHNEEEYGDAAIQSILDQSFTDFEFIIIDDASTDSTPQMLRRFAARDGRIRILTNDVNLTVPRCANRGMESARGKYIARMDSDDYAYPCRLEKQIEFLESNPEFILVGGGVEYMRADGTIYRKFDRGAKPWEFDWVSIFRAPLAQPAAMFRATAVTEHAQFYDDAYNRAADFEYWQRILRYGKGCELPGAFIKYRIHDRNISTRFSGKQKDAARRAAIKNAILRFPEIDAADISKLFRFLYPESLPDARTLSGAMRTIAQMQALYSAREGLSVDQIGDVNRKTAKLLIHNALSHGLHKRFDTASDVLRLVARYHADYLAEGTRILRRRALEKIAA